MAETVPTPVKNLSINLSNFRTVPQQDETQAVRAMIAISPDRFWALMESLIEDGYLPTENILVLQTGADQPKMTVKEGNRRVAALKLIHGYLPITDLSIPANIIHRIRNIHPQWKVNNLDVPCALYTENDEAIVDKIVSLTHGKAQKAGRDQWNAVARARHNRDVNNVSQPDLDLLEKFLVQSENILLSQREHWAGDYPLTVLEEAMKRIANRFGASNAPDLAKKYPMIPYRDILDAIIKDIGLEIIRFPQVRDKAKDFTTDYGLPALPSTDTTKTSTTQSKEGSTTSGAASDSANQPQTKQNPQDSTSSSTSQGQAQNPSQGGIGTGSGGHKTTAAATNDPKLVKRLLRNFKVKGNNRQKVEALRKEAINLDLSKTPLAFCFVTRSMFEISAKAYCDDHKASGGPTATKAGGEDRKLVDILEDITKHLTTLPNQKQDQSKLKLLHGSLTELKKPEGILSVTSMNQLVHNPRFSVLSGDVTTVFGNIFPLLEAMNQ